MSLFENLAFNTENLGELDENNESVTKVTWFESKRFEPKRRVEI